MAHKTFHDDFVDAGLDDVRECICHHFALDHYNKASYKEGEDGIYRPLEGCTECSCPRFEENC